MDANAAVERLAELEDRLSGLAERYRSASDALRAAAEQVRVMRETGEFASERRGLLSEAPAPVKEWLQGLLDEVGR